MRRTAHTKLPVSVDHEVGKQTYALGLYGSVSSVQRQKRVLVEIRKVLSLSEGMFGSCARECPVVDIAVSTNDNGIFITRRFWRTVAREALLEGYLFGMDIENRYQCMRKLLESGPSPSRHVPQAGS